MTARDDLSHYKPRLRDYLRARGITIVSTDADRIHCLAHADDHASMILYERARGAKKDRLYCPVCAASLDIFEAARIIAGIPSGDDHFPAVLEEVRSSLGESTDPTPARHARAAPPAAPAPAPAPAAPPAPTHVSLDLEAARDYYVKPTILKLASSSLRAKVTEIEGFWRNLDPDGRLAFVEYRFPASCFEDAKKKYLTLWFDGDRIRAKDPPYLLYNRDKLAKDTAHALAYSEPMTDALFHEGPKSIFGLGDLKGGESIPGFISTGWNSGGKKIGLVDFEPARGHRAYIYPDDDEPGHKTAFELKSILEDKYDCIVKISLPLPEARALKPGGGADIIEALQVRTPEELAEYIRNGPELGDTAGDTRAADLHGVPGGAAPATQPPPAHPSRDVTPPPPPAPGVTARAQPTEFPFKILGTADDGLTYFLDEAEHLQRFRLSTLSKGQLLVLAGLSWWASNFGHKGRVSWDDALDFIVRASNSVDFDPEQRRGRGAWRERDGRLCYHDGRRTIGDPDPGRLYMRKTRIDIGLADAPADAATRLEILEAAGAMSFETQADCARALAWAVLAPFAGALPWRPAGFLTGSSSSGKSSIIDLVIRPLSRARSVSGGDSSGAGIRQWVGNDAWGIIVEEAEDDTKKKRERREEIFSLMRMSTSDEAPPAVKGTVDGQPMQFALRSMFLFAAISPEVESIADQNRFATIALKKPDGDWPTIKERVKNAVTDKACRGVRAFTWAHLPQIMADADRIADRVQELGKLDSRRSYSESILFSAWWQVFKDHAPDATELDNFIVNVYHMQAPEERRDEAVELVDRILDEPVPVSGDRTKTYTLRRILYGVKYERGPAEGDVYDKDGMRALSNSEVSALRSTAILYGLGIDPAGDLAIVNEHHQICRITGHGTGYKKILWRHPCLAERSKTVNFTPLGDKSRRCTTLRGVIADDELPF